MKKQNTVMRKFLLLLAIFCIINSSCMAAFAAQTVAKTVKTEKTGTEKLFVAGRPTIFCFGGSYCPACKRALPALKATQKKYDGRATILYLDVEENTALTREFPLQVIPTYFFYDKNGKIYVPSKRVAGQIEFNELKNKKTGKPEWLLHMGGLSEAELETILADLGVK